MTIEQVEDLSRCILCHNDLPDGDSPWSICYDPEWKRNVWGGDTHEYIAMLCESCAKEIIEGKQDANLL